MLTDVAHVSHAFASLIDLCKTFPETRERNLADRAFDAFNTFSEAIQAVAKPQVLQDGSDEDTEDIEAQIEAELNAAATDGYSQELYSSDEAHQAAMSIAPSALPFGAQQPIMNTFETNSFLQTCPTTQDATTNQATSTSPSQVASSQVATSQDASSQDATSQVASSQDATSQDATSQVVTRKLVKPPTPEQERHANMLRQITMCLPGDL
jgi:chemotaxis protein histidine kinase CheA